MKRSALITALSAGVSLCVAAYAGLCAWRDVPLCTWVTFLLAEALL